MKFILKIKNMYQGMAFPAIFLAFVCTVAIFMGVNAFASVNGQIIDYRFLSSGDFENCFYCIGSPMMSPKAIEAQIAIAKESPVVESVYPFWVGDTVQYAGNYFSVLLYAPGFIDHLPLMKQMGIDFSKDENGCVLGSQIFRQAGDTISLKFKDGKTRDLTVNGHAVSPYKFIWLHRISSKMDSTCIVRSGDFFLMQANPEVLEMMTNLNYECAFVYSVKGEANPAAIEALNTELGKQSMVVSFQEILENSKGKLKETLVNSVPRPAFHLLAALVAYISFVILTVRKKERALATAYLCGAGKKSLFISVVTACGLVTLIPAIINAALILAIPTLSWKDALNIGQSAYTPDLIWIVAGYFVLTLLVALITVAASFRRHTPLSYLRGLE